MFQEVQPSTCMIGIVSVLLGLLVYLAKKAFLVCTEYRQKLNALKGVGCDELYWIIGHLHLISPTEKALHYAVNLAKRFPKCYQLWFGPLMVYINVFHPHTLKPILATDEGKDDLAYRFMTPWIGDGLLTSSGNKWRRNRRLLTPAFHFDILKHYLVVFNKSSHELLHKWSSGKEGFVRAEMFHDVSRMALDSILQCIMSNKSKCQQTTENEYLTSVSTLTEVAMKRIFNPFYHFDWIFHLSPMGRRYRKALHTARNYTERVVLERKTLIKGCKLGLDEYIAERKERKERGEDVTLDFLDTLLLAKDQDGTGLTHSEICDEVNTFVFEGHDTTTSGISWAFYNLAVNPECQEKCRREVNSILGSRDHIEWEDLSKFSYLTMFIKESLRLFPPVFSIARRTTKPLFCPRGFGSDAYNVDEDLPPGPDASRILPEKLNIGILIFVLHRHPGIWEDPETFDPRRFTPDNISKRSPHAYLPFSSGPRNCIGQHFAMNEMKVVLALALTRFRFVLDGSFPKPVLEPHIILRSGNGIHLKIERLHMGDWE